MGCRADVGCRFVTEFNVGIDETETWIWGFRERHAPAGVQDRRQAALVRIASLGERRKPQVGYHAAVSGGSSVVAEDGGAPIAVERSVTRVEEQTRCVFRSGNQPVEVLQDRGPRGSAVRQDRDILFPDTEAIRDQLLHHTNVVEGPAQLRDPRLLVVVDAYQQGMPPFAEFPGPLQGVRRCCPPVPFGEQAFPLQIVHDLGKLAETAIAKFGFGQRELARLKSIAILVLPSGETAQRLQSGWPVFPLQKRRSQVLRSS